MLISQRPSVSQEKLEGNRARFTITPLEPGFGYTLGNSIRRVLLSSLPGAAVTAVKIDGAAHEFLTLPGVKEEVIEIILNVKDIIVSSSVDSVVVAKIEAKGVKGKEVKVTAGDIKLADGVEIHNPDLVIATLTDEKAKLNIEFSIERGRGFVSAEINKQYVESKDQIALDSAFTPVKRATYSVERTRVGDRHDFDKLTIDVTTKADHIDPASVFAAAGSTLVELFGLVKEIDAQAEGLTVEAFKSLDLGGSSDAGVLIDVLGLSQRSYNALRRASLHTIDQLIATSRAELSTTAGFGNKSVEEVEEKLALAGYSLADSAGSAAAAAIDSLTNEEEA